MTDGSGRERMEESGSEDERNKKKYVDKRDMCEAADEGDTDRVKRLLAEGVNPNAADRWQRTPLHWAARRGHHGIVSALLTAGADVSVRDEKQSTPLHLAAMNSTGQYETVSALLTAGADVNARDEQQRTPLHLAARDGHVSALLAAGADVNARDKEQMTPLHEAARNGHHKSVSALLAAGADVNARDNEQYTPLHVTAVSGHRETVSALLAAGADVDTRNERQWTPLHLAALNGHHETVSALLAAGADVDARNNARDTSLHEAAERGYHETVSVLLKANADMNARNDDQNTPLHWAAWYDNHETVSTLLAAGADVNARNKWGNTPLHDAAISGHPKCAELLLQHGADAGIRDKEGLTAEDIAADEDTRDAHPQNEDEKELILHGRKEILTLVREEKKGVSARKNEYDPVLVRFYEEKGMTVAKNDCPLIQEAAKESGKTVKQVKNFIGSYRKSKGGSKRRAPTDDMAAGKSGITGDSSVPLEIQLRGPRMQQLYSKACRQGALPVHSTLGLVVGQFRSGKTCVVRRLTGEEAVEDEPITDGIEISQSVMTKTWRKAEEEPDEFKETMAIQLAAGNKLNTGKGTSSQTQEAREKGSARKGCKGI
ncbi:serine/threonine-protein phosphatase 6 regulatory ankyrin repeat subunit A-like [Branchiostoma lanceolatum]|uniref:serine/threonine-protein phosphatase 6 regulatory ankyrin repeat subunit A-like n=1 Tax=Branchiostoma lanceolatum TaxID=7740 RepID=UPI00345301E7